jgi:hypothetical protein
MLDPLPVWYCTAPYARGESNRPVLGDEAPAGTKPQRTLSTSHTRDGSLTSKSTRSKKRSPGSLCSFGIASTEMSANVLRIGRVAKTRGKTKRPVSDEPFCITRVNGGSRTPQPLELLIRLRRCAAGRAQWRAEFLGDYQAIAGPARRSGFAGLRPVGHVMLPGGGHHSGTCPAGSE